MTLVNEGTILADGTSALVIDTGTNAITDSGTLKLDVGSNFSGSVSGFDADDKLDLRDLLEGAHNPVGACWRGGVGVRCR